MKNDLEKEVNEKKDKVIIPPRERNYSITPEQLTTGLCSQSVRAV